MLRVVEQASLSDVGRQRNANEDAFFAGDDGRIFAVADGMGGARAGEVAAQAAVEELSDLAEAGESALADAVIRANRRIHDLSRGDESLAGMGTTMTLLALDGNEVAIAHVGDSRAYRMRGDELERLTHDHSLVDEMVRAGKLTPEEAEVHPQRSIITRALGPEPDVEVERLTYTARAGDVYLICSDGLTTMVPEDAVAAILRGRSSLEQAAEELVRAANEAGGRDNVTVVLFKLGAEETAGADEQATTIAPARSDSTMVFDEDRRPARPARPERPRRSRRMGRWATAIIALLVVGAVGVGFWVGSRQFYFVGTDDRGLVTLYQGLPYELPFGIELWEEEYSTAVPATFVPETRRKRILDHRLRSRGDAVDLIKQVERGELED